MKYNRISENSKWSVTMPSKEWLENQYIVLGKSTREIGKEYDVSKTTIKNWLNKYEIELKSNRANQHGNFHELDKNLLYDLYVNKQYSCGEIAKMLGVAHNGTIGRHLKKHGIETRTQEEAQNLDRYKKNQSESMKKRYKEHPEDRAIHSAGLQGIDYKDWTGFVNPVRQRICATEEYKKWKMKVFKRDNHTCQECGSKDNLHAHHTIHVSDILKPINLSVDFYELRKNLIENTIMYLVGNGKALCAHCHSNAHPNRRCLILSRINN